MQPTLEQIKAAKVRIRYNAENLHFAITGTAGSGKSSLINALRRMQNNTRKAAKTGITETTLKIGRYPDPDRSPPRSRFIWYDVPGAGTLNAPGWQHFNDQALFVFDIILVVIDNRFTKIDAEILRNCRRSNIPSFIVRSKADQHILNLMNDLPDDENEDDDEDEDDDGDEGEGGDERDDGNEGDDDDDDYNDIPKAPVDKYTRAREHFIAATRKSVFQNLEKAELPQQDVYIISKELIYHLMSRYADPSNMIDEKKLLRDMLSAVHQRRYPSASNVLVRQN
jgi:GTP-binding protein EngB required for normal cell division